MTKDEALKLALEALERCMNQPNYGASWTENAITAIKEALTSPNGEAQPEQEPMAWISKHGVVYPLEAKDEVHPINELQPLYTTPPQRQPLTDERLELIGHADLTINNIYVFSGYGEEVPEGRTPIYAGYKAAHGIKGET